MEGGVRRQGPLCAAPPPGRLRSAAGCPATLPCEAGSCAPTALGGLPAVAVAPTSGAPRGVVPLLERRGDLGPGVSGTQGHLQPPSPFSGPWRAGLSRPDSGRVGPRGPGGRLGRVEETCGAHAALWRVVSAQRCSQPSPEARPVRAEEQLEGGVVLQN